MRQPHRSVPTLQCMEGFVCGCSVTVNSSHPLAAAGHSSEPRRFSTHIHPARNHPEKLRLWLLPGWIPSTEPRRRACLQNPPGRWPLTLSSVRFALLWGRPGWLAREWTNQQRPERLPRRAVSNEKRGLPSPALAQRWLRFWCCPPCEAVGVSPGNTKPSSSRTAVSVSAPQGFRTGSGRVQGSQHESTWALGFTAACPRMEQAAGDHTLGLPAPKPHQHLSDSLYRRGVYFFLKNISENLVTKPDIYLNNNITVKCFSYLVLAFWWSHGRCNWCQGPQSGAPALAILIPFQKKEKFENKTMVQSSICMDWWLICCVCLKFSLLEIVKNWELQRQELYGRESRNDRCELTNRALVLALKSGIFKTLSNQWVRTANKMATLYNRTHKWAVLGNY